MYELFFDKVYLIIHLCINEERYTLPPYERAGRGMHPHPPLSNIPAYDMLPGLIVNSNSFKISGSLKST
jgi:hypothetical protein